MVLRAAVASLLLAPALAVPDLGAEELWGHLRKGGLVVLVRHARAPGNFDPPGFRIDDCATQRNLSEAGRAQARRLGEAVRRNGVEVAQVRSSRWCRARDTAAEAFGRYEPWPDLDSYVGHDRGNLPERAARVRDAISAWRGPGTLVLVSHHWVISEVTGRAAGDAEMLVVEPRPGGLSVLGTLRVD